ncbi:unnamed protein product [Rotaria magnacalcarata]|uniref:C2H2-type domain-containing protein n=2 Tax=Rotaria magnacalcarata TaxID=392030 RepID=A0A819ICR3_9BILA|nr:unnamed protein product [Rotaria magnacalcarata]CAF1622899.1 unnamed protein product [Rotaria magnacalcarata]CAF2066312.1 unnamed protein product [Rotaria magnacalcarata]CAF2119270.1 unnamed protein product [Rotaria magnacalcarata]CAF2138960.1 unnamed protein product [Rotaria magnacalcarata]
MSNVKIIKPIPKYANVVNGNSPQTTATIKPLAVAATTLKEGSVVYLLHQLPYNFLLTDFYDHNQHYNKIPIHAWNQHLIGPGLFQEWIIAIKSARTPDEQNLELFQSTETSLFGFRTTRLVLPDEPLLAWFSLPQLRSICEKIKLTKIFKVEELLKSTRCPRCKVEQHYLNVLVAHVLLDQCRDATSSVNLNERLFVHASPTKKCSIDFPLSKRSLPSPPPVNPLIHEKQKDEEIKEKPDDLQHPIPFASSDVSSYKMSVLDGTHALEFTSLDNDGRQRKAHLCLFCGKVYNRKYGLKIHLRTHTGYKPLQCRVCFRPFSDPSNLNKHIRLHSTATTSSSSSSVSHKRPFEEQEELNMDSSDSSNINTLDDN